MIYANGEEVKKPKDLEKILIEAKKQKGMVRVTADKASIPMRVRTHNFTEYQLKKFVEKLWETF